MGWVEIRQKPCRCPTPPDQEIKAAGIGLGSIWECDECGQRWRLAEHQLDGLCFERIKTDG